MDKVWNGFKKLNPQKIVGYSWQEFMTTYYFLQEGDAITKLSWTEEDCMEDRENYKTALEKSKNFYNFDTLGVDAPYWVEMLVDDLGGGLPVAGKVDVFADFDLSDVPKDLFLTRSDLSDWDENGNRVY